MWPNDLDEIRRELAQTLRPARYLHSLGVERTSMELAQRFGADVAACGLAGLLHDCARDMSSDELIDIARHRAGSEVCDEMLRTPVLLHGIVGALVAQEKYGVRDERVLDAIRRHTTGSTTMTAEDKIVCLADYIEPGRTFPGVDDIRSMACSDLNAALLAAFDSTIRHLLDAGCEIETDTIRARNAVLWVCRRRN